MLLRTLMHPKKPVFGDFQIGYFCDQAIDGTPMNSSHTLFDESSGLWIGTIFKEFSWETWQISLIGDERVIGVSSEDFDDALKALWDWHLKEFNLTQEWRLLHELPILSSPPPHLIQRQGDRVSVFHAQKVLSFV